MITKTVEIRLDVYNKRERRRQNWVVTTYRLFGIPVYVTRQEVSG